MARSGVGPVGYVAAAAGALAVFGGAAYTFMQIDPPEAPPPPPTIEQIVAAADADPTDAAAWAALCTATAKSYWRESSLADCDKAVELAPGSVQARLDRAFLDIKVGRIGEARQAFDWVLEREPGEARALFGRSLLKVQAGDAAGAAPDRAAALAANPEVVIQLEDAYDFRVPPEQRR